MQNAGVTLEMRVSWKVCQAHLGSYFPSVVPLWNSLQQQTVSAITQLAFKRRLKLSFYPVYELSFIMY